MIRDMRRPKGRCSVARQIQLGLSLAVLIVAPWVSVPLCAQTDRFDGEPIVEVEYVGTSLSADTLKHYLFGRDTGEQPSLDLDALNTRIQRLWDRDLIEDLALEVEPVEGGVKLVFRIVDRMRLMSVDYVGLKRISKTDIKERIDRDRIEVYEGQPIQRGELERLVTLIEEMYREKGFRFAQVRYAMEEIANNQIRVTYTLDEGDKVKIGDIRFDGNTVFSDLRLQLAMKNTKESNLVWRLFKKDIYNPASLDEDLEKVRDLYRRQGFKDVLIARPEIDVDAKRPNAPTIKEQKRRLAITIPVEEGERWKLGEVSIDGNEVLTDEFLLRQFERPRGSWLRSKAVNDFEEKVGKLYQSLGHVFSQVETELREREGQANVADLVVHIDERDQFRVGRMTFDGNSKTRDKVLRREMLVQESSVMNMNGLRNSLLKIRQLNYFTLDEDEPIDFDFDAEAKTVDLTVKGEEADRTELQFGGGFSEFDGFFGQFSIRTTNFLGRGETVGASAQIGRQRDLFNLEYRIPWWLDRPQSLGVNLFNSSIESRVQTDVDFQQSFSGGSVTYGRNLGAFQSLNLTYSFLDSENTQTLFQTDGTSLSRVNNFTTSSLRPFWLFNTLDSRFEPFRGLRATASIEFAGGALGGSTEFIKPIIGATFFKPISRRPFKSTFAINAQMGYITGIGGASDRPELFAQQRFFLGGESTVRGFRRRSLTAINESGEIIRDEDGFPLGGEKMAQFNLEYHVVMGGPFRLVLFGDAGGVFAASQDFDPDLMRYSAGIELRVLVPLFGAPLRFIWARNLDPLPLDQFESFDFNIGTSF